MNPWSDILFLHPSLLNHAIADPSDCKADAARLEDISCTQELIGQFEADYGLQLSKEERKALGEIGCMGDYDDFVEEAIIEYSYVNGYMDQEMRAYAQQFGLYENYTTRVQVPKKDWQTTTDQQKVDHLYKWLRFMYFELVCIQNEIVEFNTSHSYSFSDFFHNFTGVGEFWSVQNVHIKMNNTTTDFHSLTIRLPTNTTNYNTIKVLGTATAGPNGNGQSGLHSIYWPRGSTTSQNNETIIITADQSTIQLISSHIFPTCD